MQITPYHTYIASQKLQVISAALSNTWGGLPASNCIDGDIGNICASATSDAWLRLDLGATRQVGYVIIWNRASCCVDRLARHQIWIGNTADGPDGAGNVMCFDGTAPATVGPFKEACLGQGQYVFVYQNVLYNQNLMNIAEVEVYTGVCVVCSLMCLYRHMLACFLSVCVGYVVCGTSY